MEPQSVFATVVLIGIGVVVLIVVILGYFMQMGAPPTGPNQVIQYYDDLFEGQIGGEKVNPASIALGFLIPLLSSFSILWALIGILPVFSKNERPAMVLSLGISFYFVPAMSWMLISIFPPLLGVSSVLIGIAVLLASIFILASTGLWYKGIHKHSTSLPPGESGYKARFPWEPEEKKSKDTELRKEINDFIKEIDNFEKECRSRMSDPKNINLVDTYKSQIANNLERINKLYNTLTKSKLQDWQKETDKAKLEGAANSLKILFNELIKIEKKSPSRKKLEEDFKKALEKAKKNLTSEQYNELVRLLDSYISDEGLNKYINDLIKISKRQKCPKCGWLEDEDAKYCGTCGTALKPGVPRLPAPTPPGRGKPASKLPTPLKPGKKIDDTILKLANEAESLGVPKTAINRYLKTAETNPEEVRKQLEILIRMGKKGLIAPEKETNEVKLLRKLISEMQEMNKKGGRQVDVKNEINILNVNDQSKVQDAIQSLQDKKKWKKEEIERIVNKEKYEDIRKEWYIVVNAIATASWELIATRNVMMSNRSVMSNDLRNKCDDFITKTERLYKEAKAMKTLFLTEKPFDKATKEYYPKFNFSVIISALNNAISAQAAFEKTAFKEMKQKIETKGKKTTYEEEYKHFYKEILPDTMKKIEKTTDELGVQIDKLGILLSKTAKKESEKK